MGYTLPLDALDRTSRERLIDTLEGGEMTKFRGQDFAVNLLQPTAGQPVTVQGFSIDPPPSPTGQGGFITSPTPIQTVAKTTVQVPYTCYPAGKIAETCYKGVVVTASFQWQSVYNAETQKTPISQEVTYTTGVTTTNTETESFAATIGVSVTAGYGPISASLSASFTETTQQQHSVAFTEQNSIANTFGPVPPNTTAQYWQLVEIFEADNGDSIAQNLNYFLALTYPT